MTTKLSDLTTHELRALAIAVNATRVTGGKASVGTGTGEARAQVLASEEVNVAVMRDDERVYVAKLSPREARLLVATHAH